MSQGAHNAAGCGAEPRLHSARISVAARSPYLSTRPLRAFTLPSSRVRADAASGLLASTVEALFKVPPIYNFAAGQARKMIIQRAESLGVDWEGRLEDLWQYDWQSKLDQVADRSIEFPSYYTQPFHAYPKGNLCWEAALEVSMAAISVHATVMDPTGKTLDPRGDLELRASYGRCLRQLMVAQGGCPDDVEVVVDLGCATGLSSTALRSALPAAGVTGVDLSPHFLAVAKQEQEQRELLFGVSEPIRYLHASVEDTRLPTGGADVVSACLVLHELPQSATSALLAEAFRLLAPGGFLCIMEMNPSSSAFQRVLRSPVAYPAFKSTEPWLEEYITLDLHAAISAAGFAQPMQLDSTPRHRTIVARKR